MFYIGNSINGKFVQTGVHKFYEHSVGFNVFKKKAELKTMKNLVTRKIIWQAECDFSGTSYSQYNIAKLICIPKEIGVQLLISFH